VPSMARKHAAPTELDPVVADKSKNMARLRRCGCRHRKLFRHSPNTYEAKKVRSHGPHELALE
jgi:hypothetical protein